MAKPSTSENKQLNSYLEQIRKMMVESDRDAINGIDTLDRIKTFDPEIPVVMLSAQDKIDLAINCMHHKAFDYVVKSETAFMRLKKKSSLLFLEPKSSKSN
jgi:DNA-binding NtrC family response regulator